MQALCDRDRWSVSCADTRCCLIAVMCLVWPLFHALLLHVVCFRYFAARRQVSVLHLLAGSRADVQVECSGEGTFKLLIDDAVLVAYIVAADDQDFGKAKPTKSVAATTDEELAAIYRPFYLSSRLDAAPDVQYVFCMAEWLWLPTNPCRCRLLFVALNTSEPLCCNFCAVAAMTCLLRRRGVRLKWVANFGWELVQTAVTCFRGETLFPPLTCRHARFHCLLALVETTSLLLSKRRGS